MSNSLVSSCARLDVVRLSDLKAESVSWLWEPYVPLGKITLLHGDPESGKTFLSLFIAAQVTNGNGLPAFADVASQKERPRNVLFLGGEDGLSDTILPRFNTNGGIASRFIAVSGISRAVNGEELKQGVTLSHVDLLEDQIRQQDVGLLIVDPIQAFLGANVDAYRTNEVRPVLDGIAKMATRQNCAVILVGHLNKASQAKARYRGIGSIDFVAMARSVLIAGPMSNKAASLQEMFDPATGKLVAPDSKTRFAVVHDKCNIASKGRSFGFEIRNRAVNLLGPMDISAADLLDPEPFRLGRRQLAERFLMDMLAKGPRTAVDIYSAADEAGFSKHTVERASRELEGVNKHPAGKRQPWIWELKDDAPQVLDSLPQVNS